jgi:hypothetical protein
MDREEDGRSMSRSRRRGRQTPLPIAVIALLLAACPGAVAQEPDPSPSITSPPEINGVPRVGETLTATRGEWTPDSPYTTPSYQWFRCAPAATCGPIEEATTRSYRVSSTDQEHTLFIRLTVDHNGRQATADSDATSLVPRTPANTAPPEVSGTARTGQLLTASPGAWIGTPPLAFTYQWERCAPSGLGCQAIAGAASAGYVVTTADANMTLRLAVTATNAGGTSAPAYSVPTGVVERGELVNLIPPSTAGRLEVGRSLTATPGLWNDDGPIDFLYRWLRCRADGSACAPIPQGTAPTYRVSTLDVEHRLRVRVTAISDKGSAVAESALTASVQGASGKPPRPTLMSPFPVVRVSGIYTRWGAIFRRVSVRAPRGATITIDCRGAGCPFSRRARIVRVVRIRSLERAFRAGARFEIRVTKPGVVGKYTRVRIRAGRPPTRRDRCVMPGSRRPVRCPSDVLVTSRSVV